MVIQCSSATARKNRVILYLLRFIAVASGGYKTDFNFEQHYSDSVSSISSVKNSPANAIKISAVILNLASDKPDSDKNRKR